ncbi:PepSY domain-containing protein [Methylophaga nitratireducenticrescens]|uniref:PepSY domain-containing protein n=1 Tax=Methylophaga nitratireducenticrescens TaxID=754476 RepID=UPI000CDBBE4C|nr:PepSY domain-containing protein [Methylophaga nitratireducenticrescens]AUZ83391.1 peptidase M4 [Methylophaga nitratireducenticrescens]
MQQPNKITLAALFASALTVSTSVVMADDDMHSMQEKVDTFGLISVEDAKNIALKAKSGIVDDIELDGIDNGGGWEYEVEVVQEDGTEWDIDIHAKTGEIRKVERD